MRPEDREALRRQIMQHEGFRTFPYFDTMGKLTIGYGRNLSDVGISQDEALILLDADIRTAIEGLSQRLPWFPSLDPIRQRVLIDLAFNMGIAGVLGFPLMLSALRAGDFETASHELEDSRWYTQVGTRGPHLVRMLRGGVAV